MPDTYGKPDYHVTVISERFDDGITDDTSSVTMCDEWWGGFRVLVENEVLISN